MKQTQCFIISMPQNKSYKSACKFKLELTGKKGIIKQCITWAPVNMIMNIAVPQKAGNMSM